MQKHVQYLCVGSDATEKYSALSGNSVQKSCFTYCYPAIHANVHNFVFSDIKTEWADIHQPLSDVFIQRVDMWLGSLYAEETWLVKSLMPNLLYALKCSLNIFGTLLCQAMMV